MNYEDLKKKVFTRLTSFGVNVSPAASDYPEFLHRHHTPLHLQQHGAKVHFPNTALKLQQSRHLQSEAENTALRLCS